MQNSREEPGPAELRPLPYHEALLAYLKAEEAEVWNWYRSHRVRQEQGEAVRFDLLKSTYRLDRQEQPAVYATAEEVAKKLGLAVPITLYQAQNPQGLNASLAFVPDEAHIVLHGPVTRRLGEGEFRALLAHELSHFLLGRCRDGELGICQQIVDAMTLDAMADSPHFATARLLSLYTEVFCDRGALAVVGDPTVVISMLLKVETGLDEVSPASFLEQAEEVFGGGKAKTAGLSHPEACVRARAIQLWADRQPDADRQIERMLQGAPELEKLDLLAQQKVAGLTRRLIDVFVSRRWMQSETVLAHARLFFEDYLPPDRPLEDAALGADLHTDDPAMQDYYCYVLLDFVTADRDLEELPLAAALWMTEGLGLKDRFLEVVRRELRLRKKQLEAIDRDKEGLLAKAGETIAS